MILISLAWPFILIAILFLLWAHLSHRLQHRFPRYYKWCIKVYDALPVMVGAVIIAFFLYYYITTPSIY